MKFFDMNSEACNLRAEEERMEGGVEVRLLRYGQHVLRAARRYVPNWFPESCSEDCRG
jgi:hypothetical protein